MCADIFKMSAEGLYEEKSYDASELDFPESEDSFDPHAPMFPTEPTYVMVEPELLEEISIMLEYTQRVAPLNSIAAMKQKIDLLIAEAKA